MERRVQALESVLRGRLDTGGFQSDAGAWPSLPVPRDEVPATVVAQLGEVDLADMRAALAEGNKLLAIKVYRDRTGVGLKEAKDAVDAMERLR